MQDIIAQAETDRLMAHLAQVELLADTRGARKDSADRWAYLDAALRTSEHCLCRMETPIHSDSIHSDDD